MARSWCLHGLESDAHALVTNVRLVRTPAQRRAARLGAELLVWRRRRPRAGRPWPGAACAPAGRRGPAAPWCVSPRGWRCRELRRPDDAEIEGAGVRVGGLGGREAASSPGASREAGLGRGRKLRGRRAWLLCRSVQRTENLVEEVVGRLEPGALRGLQLRIWVTSCTGSASAASVLNIRSRCSRTAKSGRGCRGGSSARDNLLGRRCNAKIFQ